MGSENCSSELADPILPRKASSEALWCPYRKPTQVGEESILRRSGEPSLRNSANLPRNFGKRGAPCRVRRLYVSRPEGAAVKRPKRLFTKNTGLC
jgi:hypothetical protein